MTDEATKPSARRRKASIHSILSGNTFSAQHPQLLKIGEADSPSSQPAIPGAADLGNIIPPTRRLPEQERHRSRRTSFFPAHQEPAPGPERETQDNLKRRKLSIVAQPTFANCLTAEPGQAQREDPFGLDAEEDAHLRSFPVREYPRRLSIASVLTADSSSLPSVISPATTTGWAGLASATSSSTTTTYPPQWPHIGEPYNPLSNISPVPSAASAGTALGPLSRKEPPSADDPDFKTWELDFEAASSRIRTPMLGRAPRRIQSRRTISKDDQSITMADAEGFPEGIRHASRPATYNPNDTEFRETATLPSPEQARPGIGSHSLEAYNDLVADLQHKLSTTTLALETLRGEHNRLLGAYGRQQTRSAAIQKKCAVADKEIGSLSAERDRLQESLEQSEAQVQNLINQRDSVNRGLVARMGEYSSIVELASQMERHSVLELQRWRERDAVLRSRIAERDEVIEQFQQRIALAELAKEAGGSSQSPGQEDSTNEVSALRRENQVLKGMMQELEASVQESKLEVLRMEEIGRMLLHRSREGTEHLSQPASE